jgi:hypothetical protein
MSNRGSTSVNLQNGNVTAQGGGGGAFEGCSHGRRGRDEMKRGHWTRKDLQDRTHASRGRRGEWRGRQPTNRPGALIGRNRGDLAPRPNPPEVASVAHNGTLPRFASSGGVAHLLHKFRPDFSFCTGFAQSAGLHRFCTKNPAESCPWMQIHRRRAVTSWAMKGNETPSIGNPEMVNMQVQILLSAPILPRKRLKQVFTAQIPHQKRRNLKLLRQFRALMG